MLVVTVSNSTSCIVAINCTISGAVQHYWSLGCTHMSLRQQFKLYYIGHHPLSKAQAVFSKTFFSNIFVTETLPYNTPHRDDVNFLDWKVCFFTASVRIKRSNRLTNEREQKTD